jgi:hypothetical protein
LKLTGVHLLFLLGSFEDRFSDSFSKLAVLFETKQVSVKSCNFLLPEKNIIFRTIYKSKYGDMEINMEYIVVWKTLGTNFKA